MPPDTSSEAGEEPLTGLWSGPPGRVRLEPDVVRHCAALVARLINMAAFGRRCIPPGRVARRSNIPDILATRALPGGRGPQRGSRAGGPGRLAALGASPYL